MVRERRNRPHQPPPSSSQPVSRESHVSSPPNTSYLPRSLLGVVVLALLATAYLFHPVTTDLTMHSEQDPSSVREFSFPTQVRDGVSTNALSNVKIQTRGSSMCRANNALIFLAQKKHGTYARDSLGLLVKALDLFRDNYLSLGNHHETVDIFLFHSGDFDESDLVYLEERLLETLPSNAKGIFRMVNINNTAYWSLPEWLQNDNQMKWKGSEIYPVGYRHMCRFFGMQLWNFFDDLNQQDGCHYRYIARLDEDSFILSPISYDIFELMKSNKYMYGYRMCAFEIGETVPKLWFKKWRRSLNATAHRWIDAGLCGFYTNFFVADLEFFLSPNVTKFLLEIDRRGHFYRHRFGDVLVHTLAVYAFAPSLQIHRFLDFTYQHATIDYFKDREKKCISWGAIQAGYNDPNAEQIVDQFYETHVLKKDCPTANMTYILEEDLSPTYAHIPGATRKIGDKVSLKTVHAGKVELPGQGILSG